MKKLMISIILALTLTTANAGPLSAILAIDGPFFACPAIVEWTDELIVDEVIMLPILYELCRQWLGDERESEIEGFPPIAPTP